MWFKKRSELCWWWRFKARLQCVVWLGHCWFIANDGKIKPLHHWPKHIWSKVNGPLLFKAVIVRCQTELFLGPASTISLCFIWRKPLTSPNAASTIYKEMCLHLVFKRNRSWPWFIWGSEHTDGNLTKVHLDMPECSFTMRLKPGAIYCFKRALSKYNSVFIWL